VKAENFSGGGLLVEIRLPIAEGASGRRRRPRNSALRVFRDFEFGDIGLRRAAESQRRECRTVARAWYLRERARHAVPLLKNNITRCCATAGPLLRLAHRSHHQVTLSLIVNHPRLNLCLNRSRSYLGNPWPHSTMIAIIATMKTAAENVAPISTRLGALTSP
jgi:hypothetical protein